MNITGRRKTVEDIDVEIDPVDFLRTIYQRSIPAGLEYLSSADEWWYCADSFNYHNREDLYKRVRPATEDELQFYKAYQLLVKFAQNI